MYRVRWTDYDGDEWVREFSDETAARRYRDRLRDVYRYQATLTKAH